MLIAVAIAPGKSALPVERVEAEHVLKKEREHEVEAVKSEAAHDADDRPGRKRTRTKDA